MFFFRISLTGVCRMNLRKYPMDTQKCVLNIMSCKLMVYMQLWLQTTWEKESSNSTYLQQLTAEKVITKKK